MRTQLVKINVVIFIGVLFCNTGLFAAHEKGSSRLNLSLYNSTTNNALFLQDDKYSTINSNLATPSAFGFFDHTYKNKLVFGIDRTVTSLGAISSNLTNNVFRAEIDVKVSYNKLVPSGSGYILSGISVIKTLTVSFSGFDAHLNPSAPTSEIDIDDFNFEKGYQTIANIAAVRIYNSTNPNTAINTTNVPANIFLELQYDAERYYDLTTSAVLPYANASDIQINYLTGATTGNEIEVKWSRIVGADEYELEWLWLDEFTYGNGTTVPANASWLSSPELNFKNNATRIRTDQNSYSISNIYESGHLFCRIRGVGRTKTPAALIALGNPIISECFSNWTWPDVQTISNNIPPAGAGGGLFGTASLPHFIDLRPMAHEQNKNWVYTGTYAEDGKKQEVVSYFDGSQHSRQTVTKNNSDNKAIVAETYFDFIGRPTMQAMPTPVDDATLKFYQETVGAQTAFNFDNSGTPKAFTKDAFALSVPATPCIANNSGINNLYGTGKYYSINNPFQNLNFYNGYTPDGENFPFTQTEYTSDNTGKIARQSGVGAVMKIENAIGVDKHDSRYLYGSVTQEELDQLFGSEAGYSKHYTKNVVVDPNGQVSISYLNQEGKVVATALSGVKPSNLQPLFAADGTTDLSASSNPFQVDLLNKLNASDTDKPTDNNELKGDELAFNEKIIVTSQQNYSFDYSALGTNYAACGATVDICYDCIYDLEFDIRDKCNNRPAGFNGVTYTLGKIIGSPPTHTNPAPNFDQNCGNDQLDFSFQQIVATPATSLVVLLEIGEYTITKKLKVNQTALQAYLKDYLANCPTSPTAFDAAEATNLDVSGCEMDCAECVAALGTLTNFLTNNPNLTTQQATDQYNEMVKDCVEPCQYDSYCDVTKEAMLVDMSPSGQYAEFTGFGSSFDANSFPVSIFNVSNALPRGSAGIPKWKTPLHYLTATQEYLNENGQQDYVSVFETSPGVYTPPVQTNPPAGAIIAGTGINQFLVKPQYLASASDFVANFKPSWAQSLLKYHPEYCYIEWCLKNSTPGPNFMIITNVYDANNNIISNVGKQIITSDDFDSLYTAVDDLDDLQSAPYNSHAYLLDPIQYDPYWSTSGYYYVAPPTPPLYMTEPDPALNNAVTGNVQQRQGVHKTPHDFSGIPNMYFNEKTNKTANYRFYNYKNSGLSLYQYAALLATPLAQEFGQSMTSLLAKLKDTTNISTCYFPTSFPNTPSTYNYILNLKKPGSLANDDSYKRKAWENFKTLYLALKQELQQEAAQSYAMNGGCRTCNDCIGKSDFDEKTVKFTPNSNLILAQILSNYNINTWPANLSSLVSNLATLYYKNWFINDPAYPNNKDQICGLGTKELFKNKIKRFNKSEDALGLIGDISNTQASIFNQTGLCPNAYDLQSFLNALFSGAKTIYTITPNNISSNIPEFSQGLYQAILPIVPVPFQNVFYNCITPITGNILNANIQINNVSCPMTLALPSSLPTGIDDWANYIGATPTFTINQLGGLMPNSATGFNIQATISYGPVGNVTSKTLVLTGNTNLIQLKDCNFAPPCKANGTGKAISALLNTFSSNGVFPAPFTTQYNPGFLTPTGASPFKSIFVNTFKPLLENISSNAWQWTYNGGSEILISDNNTGNKQLKIAFTTPFVFNGLPVPDISCIQSFKNFRPDPSGTNSGAFIIDGVISNIANVGSCTSGTFQLKGTVSIGNYITNTYVFSPLEVGRCSFDLTTCNTQEHEVKRDLEKWMLSSGSGFVPMVSSLSAQNISNNTFFTSLLRSYLNSSVTYNSNIPQQNYYHWLPDAGNTNSNKIAGWITVSQSQTAPSTAPDGSCYFIIKKIQSGGTTVATLLNTIGNTFAIATSPYLNNNVYTFKLSPGTAVDSLICSSSCFPLRACSSCTGTSTAPVPNSAPTTIIIEDFKYTNTTPDYQLTNNSGIWNYKFLVMPAIAPLLNDAAWACYDVVQNGGITHVPGQVYLHWPGYAFNYGSAVGPPCNFFAGQTCNFNSPGLFFVPGPNYIIDKNCPGYTAPMSNFFDNTNQTTTFIKNFQVQQSGNYVINYPLLGLQNSDVRYYFNNTLIQSIPNVINIGSTPCNYYNYTTINPYPYSVSLIAGQSYQIKIEMEHLAGYIGTRVEMHPITATLINATGPINVPSQNVLPCANTPWPTDTMPTAMYEEPCAPYLQDLIDNTADEKYDAYLDSTKTIFTRNYIKHCMSSVIENLAMKYNNTDYHYTLYYYDQAGNLSRTVPPQGVKPVNLANIYSGGQTNGQAIKQDRDSYYNVGYVKKVYTQHKFSTTYTYNSLNQLIRQKTPDAGLSKFYYDNLGRLVASQNAEQKFQSTTAPVAEQKYSFTQYDALGRISMVGVFGTYDLDALSPIIPNGQTVKDALSSPGYPINLNTVFGNIKEVTQTYYGEDAGIGPIILASNFSNGHQDNLRSRVASVSVESVWDGLATTYDHATHYSYDIHGNVKELLQDNPEMGRFTNQRFKRIQYTYDLISGKVNTVVYQRGQRDMFAHSYLYDAANRITNVYTSRDSLLWSQDAKYYYYLHGPLARVEMGEHKVQSLDYAYTLQGWIKGVNSEGLKADYDIGKDGYSVLTGASNSYNLNRFNARDGFGYTLGYYNVTNPTVYKDYLPVNGFNGTPSTYFIGTENLGASSLFNGNIMGMSTSYLNPSPVAITSAALDITGASIAKYDPYCFQRRFAYDQLNRIKTAEVVGRNIDATNTWINTGAPTSKFYESFKYDQNGNITNLSRKSNVGNMDDLTYYYYDSLGIAYNPQTTTPTNDVTNKLAYVTDVNGASTIGDIGTQNSNNYTYDKIGNLKTDVAENISTIDWSVYGKIKNITTSNVSGVNLSFKYDASGNRVNKTAADFNGGSTSTYYVRDAQGNIMATYTKALTTQLVFLQPSIVTEDLFLSELDIYGSSRLGMLNNNDYIGAIVNNVNQPITALALDNRRTLGTRSYELSNHLGNVVAVVSDRKLAVSTSGNPNLASYFVPDIVSANDYYAFGSPMPGRQYNNGNYRHGFNGMEKDDEVKGSGNQYTSEHRAYDPRLGRWMSIDPKASDFPESTPYNNNDNNPIFNTDPNGDCPWCVWGAIIGAAVDYGAQVAANYANDNPDPWTDIDGTSIAISAGAGALSGGVSAFGRTAASTSVKLAVKYSAPALIDAAASTANQIHLKGTVSGDEVIKDVVIGKVARGVVNKILPKTSVNTKPLDRAKRLVGDNPKPTRVAAVKVAEKKEAAIFGADKLKQDPVKKALKSVIKTATSEQGTTGNPTPEKPSVASPDKTGVRN